MSLRIIEPYAPPQQVALPRDIPGCGALVGVGLAGAYLATLLHNWQLDLIDSDVVEGPQTILPPFATPGVPKATAAQAYRSSRFPWLGPGLALNSEVQAVGGGYWRSLALCQGVLFAMTDSVATQQWLGATARQHGLAVVATGLGPDSAQVFVAPADPGLAAFCCRELPVEIAPQGCFAGSLDQAVPANAGDPPSTNSAPYIAAAAVCTAINEAAALVQGKRTQTELITFAPGEAVQRRPVQRRSRCPVCTQVRQIEGEVVPVPRGYQETLGGIFAEVSVEDSWEVRVPPATTELACAECDWAVILKDFVILNRRLICPKCGGRNVLCGNRSAGAEWVRVSQIADRTPRGLGWGWWDILYARQGQRECWVELAGDALCEGALDIEPLVIGEN